MSEATLQAPRPAARPALDAGKPRATLLWFVALPFLASLVFIVSFVLGSGGARTIILALAVLTGMICLVPVILDQGRGTQHRHLMLSLFGLGYLMFMVAPVFTLYPSGPIEEMRGSVAIMHVLPHDVIGGQLAALAGLVAFLVAYALPLGRRVGRALPAPSRQWSSSVTILVGLALVALGWTVYLGNQFGLIPQRAGSGALGAIAGTTIFGIALLTLAYLCLGARVALIALAMLVPVTMFFNFFTGSKSMFLAAPMMVGYAYVVVRRRIPISWIALGLTVIAVFYPVSEFYRQVILEGFTLSAVDVIGDPGAVFSQTARYAASFDLSEYMSEGIRMTSGRLEGLGVLSVIVRDTPERVPFQWGWTIGYIALSYVPRLIWPGKPIITIGQWVTDHYGPGPSILSNTGPTWMGEFYLNFGYPGVVLGMATLGLYFRILHEVFFRPNATVPALLIGALAIFCTVPTIQGGVVGPINGVIMLATPFLLTHMAICAFSRPGLTASAPGHPSRSPEAPAGSRVPPAPGRGARAPVGSGADRWAAGGTVPRVDPRGRDR